MNITKFGHSCLFIEEQELRIVVDPGVYSTMQNQLHDVDVLIITHEHDDHCDINSVATIVKNNPQMTILTNKGVSEKLKKEGIASQVVQHGDIIRKKDIAIEFFGHDHAIMHSSIPPSENIGFFIAGRFFYPGDAFTNPRRPVDILALPVQGPWLKLPEAIDYALALKPKICFPIHDGIMKNSGSTHAIPKKVLTEHGIRFEVLDLDKRYEF
jgi:L-ascorbate metabolism protein UlaG (beta-lactamase superfamily)